jgi:hypothetical protein
MASLDVASGRIAGLSQAPGPANRVIATDKQQTTCRLRIALEVGGTLLVLMLMAISILALRFVLVLAHGILH